MTREEKIESLRSGRLFKIPDVLVVAVLILAVAAILFFSFSRPAAYVVISFKGTSTSYDLTTGKVIEIKDNDATVLKVVIKDKTVYVSEAHCPNKECFYMGKIKYNGQIIICAHYETVIRIQDKSGGTIILG